jgi:predicted DNA-binding transcriptional regulator AlpA
MRDTPLLTPTEAAEFLQVTEATLASWRLRDRRHGPAFVVLSRCTVRYRRSDLEEWLKSRRVAAASRSGGVAA